MKKAKSLSRWFKHTGLYVIPRHKFTEPHFEPYIKAIGSLSLAWNDLHERLSTVFVMAMGLRQFARSFALWHETRNDLGKRRLLRAAIANLPASEIGERKNLIAEVIWLLDGADSLEGLRDDSVHTPFIYTFPNAVTLAEVILGRDGGTPVVAPHTGFGNWRALSIEAKKKNMLVEMQYAKSRILVLRDYAIAIDHAWANPRVSWPDRPQLPNRKPIRRSKGSASGRKQK